MNEDPRKGRPSASSMGRYAACRGAFRLCQGLPPLPTTAVAESGTRAHADHAGEDVDLTLDESELNDTRRKLEADILLEVFNGARFDQIRERRLWNGHPLTTAEDLYSGQPDLIAFGDGKVLVLDYKTGREPIPAAEINWQLRTLISLVNFNGIYDEAFEYYGAIVAPWQSPQFSITRYSIRDVRDSIVSIANLVMDIYQPDRALTPGDHCKYCPAKAFCPALQRVAERGRDALLAASPKPMMVLSKETFSAVARLLPSDKLKELLDGSKLREWANDALVDEAKRRLEEDPASVPGYRMKPGAIKESITDIQGVFGRAVEMFQINTAEFLKTCNCRKGELKKILNTRAGLKGKALDQAVKALTQGLVTEKQNKASLEKI